MASSRFIYIWQYVIYPEHRAAFLAAYEPGGEWSRLFGRDPAYIETILLRDLEDDCKYMTIDVWASKVDRDAFQEQNADEFATLDRKCEAFTRHELLVGNYVDVADQDETAG